MGTQKNVNRVHEKVLITCVCKGVNHVRKEVNRACGKNVNHAREKMLIACARKGVNRVLEDVIRMHVCGKVLIAPVKCVNRMRAKRR